MKSWFTNTRKREEKTERILPGDYLVTPRRSFIRITFVGYAGTGRMLLIFDNGVALNVPTNTYVKVKE